MGLPARGEGDARAGPIQATERSDAGRSRERSDESAPRHRDEDRAHDGQERRNRKREAPPIDGAERQQRERKDGAALVSVPEKPTGDPFEHTYDQETSEQRSRAVDAVSLE